MQQPSGHIGSPVTAPVAELASRRHGVVTIGQLAALGIDTSAVTKLVRAGKLHRLHRGVYAVGHQNLTPHGECLAAVLSILPALKNPTISNLSDEEWVAVHTILEEITVSNIIPRLKEAGAQGIVEYPLNKIVM